MSQRWTSAQRKDFETDWLSERIGHQWAGSPTRCTACGRKYGKGAGRLCRARKRPGRWRLHCRRAMQHAQYPTVIPVRDARWLLAQMASLEADARGLEHDDRWWKYSKPARQYRSYLRRWWALPGSETSRALNGTRSPSPDRWGALFTRGRNKLLKRAQAEQVREIRDHGTVYTFVPDAMIMGPHGYAVPLFTESH